VTKTGWNTMHMEALVVQRDRGSNREDEDLQGLKEIDCEDLQGSMETDCEDVQGSMETDGEDSGGFMEMDDEDVQDSEGTTDGLLEVTALLHEPDGKPKQPPGRLRMYKQGTPPLKVPSDFLGFVVHSVSNRDDSHWQVRDH
jgi:hypothetical protein